jgi:hypothetical protein
MFFAKSKKHIQLKFCLGKFIRQIPLSSTHQHAAQHQLSHMCGTGETSLGLSCVINGNGDPTAEMQVSIWYISYKKWILGTGSFHGMYAKEMDHTILLLSTKASSSQWIHEVWEYNSTLVHGMSNKIHAPSPSILTMSDTKLLKHGVLWPNMCQLTNNVLNYYTKNQYIYVNGRFSILFNN